MTIYMKTIAIIAVAFMFTGCSIGYCQYREGVGGRVAKPGEGFYCNESAQIEIAPTHAAEFVS